ncbi:MAG: hypothetical protein WCP73_03970 [Eubacteriales bacterium]
MGKTIIELLKEDDRSKTDPLGSYTGRPANPKEKPDQDADDL